MNSTAHSCWADLPDLVDPTSVKLWLAFTGLVVVIVLVVLGNLLVILSVLMNRSLHTTTNYIVTSLATSDCLLGLVILPFSAYVELTGHWPFGSVWCQIWLAVDVWLCTASIYNLVAISFDRYMAVTRPISYKFISSVNMGRRLVTAAWVVSFVICAPPLIIGSLSSHNETATPVKPCDCSPMNNESEYIIYSAAGSFFIPMLLIFYLNLSILKHARLAGTIKLKHKQQTAAGVAGSQATLEGAQSAGPTTIKVGGNGGTAATKSVMINAKQSSSATNLKLLNRSGDSNASSMDLPEMRVHRGGTYRRPSGRPTDAKSSIGCRSAHATLQTVDADSAQVRTRNSNGSAVGLQSSKRHSLAVVTQKGKMSEPASLLSPVTPDGRSHSADSRRSSFAASRHHSKDDGIATPRGGGLTSSSATVLKRLVSTSAIKTSFDLQRHEWRVAKTIAIVISCFVVCWMPFSVIYAIQAYDICTLQLGCVPPAVFTVCFWLGYCNSAVNPFIYAAFSRELRRAFNVTTRRLLGLAPLAGSLRGRQSAMSSGRSHQSQQQQVASRSNVTWLQLTAANCAAADMATPAPTIQHSLDI